jgi:hypothetical protein
LLGDRTFHTFIGDNMTGLEVLDEKRLKMRQDENRSLKRS